VNAPLAATGLTGKKWPIPMIRINAAWLIGVNDSIDAIDKLVPGQTVLDGIGILFAAQGALEQVFSQSFYRDHVRASRAAGNALYDAITAVADANSDWNTKKIEQWAIANLRSLKGTFQTVFLADLGVMPIYIVAKKDNFDVNLLIETGIRLFPAAIMAKVPEVEKDASEVGRALAYELPTACGFHTFRVTESVVRRYWDVASEGKERPKLQTLGNFAAEMEKQKIGDEKIIEASKQMTKLHRNPLIHPEVILTVEEAIGIIGMARGVIAMMLQSMPDVPTTTGASSTALTELPASQS
jgi:hypothetical protein